MSDAVSEVGQRFTTSHPEVALVLSSGPSNGLAQQILAGAPADMFVSANQQWAAELAAYGFVEETRPLLTNRLVLVVPRGNPAGLTTPSDLDAPQIARVALAGENVPAGIYAEQALQALGLLDPLTQSHRLARGSDVRVTLAYVERGEAEAGIVYATDAHRSDQVELIAEFDPASYDPVIYHGVLLRSAADHPAAREFFHYLCSPAAQAVFQQHGFSSYPTPKDVTAITEPFVPIPHSGFRKPKSSRGA